MGNDVSTHRTESPVLLEHVLDVLRSPAAVVTADGVVVQSNAGWAAVAGDSMLVNAIADESERAHLAATLARMPLDEPPQPVETRLANGRWAQLELQAVETTDGPMWLCLVNDIHQLRSRYEVLLAHTGVQESLLDASIDCIKLIDPSGRLMYMNRAGCTALGVAPDSGFGQVWLEALPEDVRVIGQEAIDRAAAGETARFPGRSETPDGGLEYWDNLLTPNRDANGEVTSILCVARNVTDELATRQALAESQDRLKLATTVSGMGVWDFDLVTDSMICDDTWHAIMGLGPDERVTTMDQFRPLIHPDDVARATEVKHTAAQLIASGSDYAIQFRIVRPSGEMRWVRSAACLLVDETGEPYRAVGFVTDVTDHQRAHQALAEANRELEQQRALLERRSLHDDLTGLPNRRALAAELNRIAQDARVTGRTAPVSVAMIDLDHFKRYNDTQGHLAGDEVLVRFAQVLSRAARTTDFVARFGGEEFVFVLHETADPTPFLDRLYEALRVADVPHTSSPHGRVTISTGCAVFCDGASREFDAMLGVADDAMYEAKAAGRNRYVVVRGDEQD